jgi:tagaturonate reductase
VTHSELPRLNRELLASGRLTGEWVSLPASKLLELPEKAVQFGTGAFLRGFIDYFLDAANRYGAFGGRVVAVGSTRSGRDVAFNEQDGLYTLLVEGAGEAGPITERRVIGSVSRALAAERDWRDVLSLARAPGLELVFSNTTEIGIGIQDGDRLDSAPPPSFPGKLTRFLLERGRSFEYADDAGLVVMPCELIERNGDRLRDLVFTLARHWKLEAAFTDWIERAVPFCNTLVDRIVPGRPNDARRSQLERSVGFRDELMIAAEPYRLFAIEADAATRRRLAFASAEESVVLTDDVTPYRERKVRILNGGHTLLASLGLLVGCETVLEAVQHDLLGRYLQRVLFEEIVPVLVVPDGEAFARDVLRRFANPFLRHALTDITLQHTAKMRVRVIPSIEQYAARTGVSPGSLSFGFAAYLLLLRDADATSDPRRPRLAADNEGDRVREIWRAAPNGSDFAWPHRASAPTRHYGTLTCLALLASSIR